MIDQLSDEALMSAVMSGKSTALAMLVERYHSPLLGYIYRLVAGNRPLAEDIVQETFLHILQKSGYQFTISFQSLQQTTPDLLPWLAPHLIQLAIGLVFVLIVVLTFKRSRSILN